MDNNALFRIVLIFLYIKHILVNRFFNYFVLFNHYMFQLDITMELHLRLGNNIILGIILLLV